MRQALTPPFLLAALVLCVAGATKLRAPAGAARAAGMVGLPSSHLLVRLFAAFELALGSWCLVAPVRAGAIGLALLYASFTLITLRLARRRASCGCFGEDEGPASGLQAMLSALLCIVAALATMRLPHSAVWLLGLPPVELSVMAAGLATATYGTVLAYTQLPEAWAAWSGQ